ncbi:AsmA family protein [Pararhodobacter sp.]|uniref:AsmA family protein n=1 Tax=Pararhodobacter sp. TaxID=2127056 RepID=UPI002FDDB5D0
MRWIFRTIGVVVSLLVLVVAGLFLIPAERIAGIAAQQFEAATGRQLTIAGSVRPSIFPVIGARVENVSLANAPWAESGPMLQAASVDLGLDLAALIRGELVVRHFEAHGPRIVVERAVDGRLNWLFEGAGGGAGAEGATTGAPGFSGGTSGLSGLSLERAQISDASVRIIDRETGTDLRIEGLELTLSMPTFDGPGDLQLSGRHGGQDFEAEMHIGAVAGLLGGDIVTLSARLRAGATRASFEGRGGLQPLAAEGRITLEGPGLAPLMALTGGGAAEPLPPGARPLALAGQVTLAPTGSVHLREASLALGQNRLTMALDLTTDGPRPRLSGEISAPALDLTAFTGGESEGGGAAGWSRDVIDASALGLMDAAVGFTVGPVQTGIIDLTAARGTLTIDQSRAVLDLRELRLFDGTLRGELVANNRSGLSVGGNLSAQSVALLPLLRQFAGFERLSGTGELDLRFLGVGNSVDAIMRSLSGEGRLALGQGEIIGFDLAGMLRNLDLSYMGEENRTIFQSIGGSFTLQGGVLRNEDLAMEASRVSVTGRGAVDLGAQTLEYRVTPTALRNAETGEALRVPLIITGPWSAPRFRLDLEGLAEERLREEAARLEARAREEAARLEARARERVDQELQERLGIGRREGESVEDSLREGGRERLEQEIGRGLQRFLGGGGN